MERDRLFILAAPFEDNGRAWFCQQCALLEGALLANPHWAEKIDVRRVAFPRPREEVIAAVGPDHQSLPMLVLRDGAAAPFGARRHGDKVFLKDGVAITEYLAATYGGAAPHP